MAEGNSIERAKQSLSGAKFEEGEAMSSDAMRLGPSGRPYLNTAQAAHYLGIGARKLQRLRVSGEGPRFRRHGRLIYYHPEDLDNWSLATTAEHDHE